MTMSHFVTLLLLCFAYISGAVASPNLPLVPGKAGSLWIAKKEYSEDVSDATVAKGREVTHESQADESKSSLLPSIESLRGGGGNDDFVGPAYDWLVNLGAPAALVAGAVVATLYENIRGGQLEAHKGDSTYAKMAKKLTGMLLLSAFALQIISIFVTTVTGTMLLSLDVSALPAHNVKTPLAFLREHFEFEYLTSRLSFLQGLLNWLGAVALEHTIPRKGEVQATARKIDQFVAMSLGTVVLLLLSFYNAHMTFYGNYCQMVMRWLKVTGIRYFGTFRPLMILYIPGFILSIHKGIQAMTEDVTAKEDYSEVRDD